MHPRASFALALLLCCAAQLAAQQQMPAESAQQLVRDVIYNELHDRECDSFWKYRSVRITSSQNIVREQVETAKGPIYRVMEDHGSALDAGQRRQEEERLEDLIQSPTAMERIERAHVLDEDRLQRVMEMLPDAFLFRYAGPPAGDNITISFRPDPAFQPATYEGRIVHALGGTLTVNWRLKRMVDMDGHVLHRVNFGYGILGYLKSGGIFEIHRVQVSPNHWKTSLVDVHVQGKVLLFANIDKEQRESRSGFRPVPHDISLRQAKALLDQTADEDQTALQAALTQGSR
ncbi:MAG TPA: hypothetical protein VMD58_06415 [Acidobacteriaceae bacterium]|nr:hypothetical protein [Acidobacteriaceae bacterium]